MHRTRLAAGAAIAALAIGIAASPCEAKEFTSTEPLPSAATTPSGGQPMAVPFSVPDVPSVPPGIYSRSPPPGLPSRPGATAAPGQFAPAPNVGPVTGYGPGGLAQPPGAPANPPFHFGGTSGLPR